MRKIITLAITDFKIIFRDPSLRAFLLLPVLLFALMVWAVPPLVERYPFLAPYASLFLVVAVIENTQMFCFISTMVLIDEKETDVAKVYGIVPLTKAAYITSRFVLPYTCTVLLNVVMMVVQPLYNVSLGANLLISLLAALVVPVYVLGVNALVQNRMQGMVYVKAFNMVVLLPVAAFFVPAHLRHLFGLLPTHWIFQSIDNLARSGSPGWEAGVGFVFLVALGWFTARAFIKRHFV